MKISINEDEWYPVYSIVAWQPNVALEIPTPQITKWQQLFQDFEIMQKELAGLYLRAEEQKKAKPPRTAEEWFEYWQEGELNHLNCKQDFLDMLKDFASSMNKN